MIGTCGLFFFIVGYALVRNDLISISDLGSSKFNRKSEGSPNGCAGLGGLTEVEAHFFQRLREGVFA
jgi:hypothetical protein